MITLPTNDASTEAVRAKPALISTTRPNSQNLGSGPRDWLSRFECVAVAVLALLVTTLHIRFVTNVGGLWRDEVNSVNLATLPSFAEMWRVLDFDSFPALFFAVLRGWTAMFGANDDLALRALGLITGLGILGAAWASGRSFGIKWPVLSLALIGLNPMLIRYGDSTRAYGLGILLILLTLRGFWRLVDSPGPPTTRRIIEATLLAVLSVQCLYYNSVLLLAIAAGAMAVALQSHAWRTLFGILGIGMLAAASLLPYIPMMRRVREWTFLVSGPDGGFSWLWTRLCEVLGSPTRLGVWLWPGLAIVGLLLRPAFGNRQAEAGNIPGGIPRLCFLPRLRSQWALSVTRDFSGC